MMKTVSILSTIFFLLFLYLQLTFLRKLKKKHSKSFKMQGFAQKGETNTAYIDLWRHPIPYKDSFISLYSDAHASSNIHQKALSEGGLKCFLLENIL